MPDESCPRCGKPVRSMARFCHGCGATLKSQKPQQRETPKPSEQTQSKIFMSPGGPVLEPPPAPDSSFPPKLKQKEEKTPVINAPAPPATPESATRKLAPSRDTGTHEQAPSGPRRLERGGTQPIGEYSDRGINKPTVPLDRSGTGIREAQGATKPLTRVDTPTATTAVVKTDHLSQSQASKPLTQTAPTPVSAALPPKPASAPLPTPPQSPAGPTGTWNTRTEPAGQLSQTAQRPARPQSGRLQNTVQRIEPATLDSVMPHSEEPQELMGRLTQADFGTRLGAFVLDIMGMLIGIDVIVYLLSTFGNRQSLNWWIITISLISLFVIFFNWILLPSFSGQSIGKKLMGIRIMHEDGRLLTFTGAIKRHLIGYLLSALPFMFGFLSAMWSPTGRAWHDKISKTVVVKNA